MSVSNKEAAARRLDYAAIEVDRAVRLYYTIAVEGDLEPIPPERDSYRGPHSYWPTNRSTEIATQAEGLLQLRESLLTAARALRVEAPE